MQKMKSRIVFYKCGGVDFVESEITDCFFYKSGGVEFAKTQISIALQMHVK